jgi:hypothetical protein
VINAQTGTAYSLTANDAGDLITATNASAIVVTVPTNASVAFGIGTQVGVLQTGAGQVSFVGASGVTVNSYNSALKIVGNGGLAVLVKTGTNTWSIAGAVVP